MKQLISRTVNSLGKEERVTHIDWKDVELEDIKITLNKFAE